MKDQTREPSVEGRAVLFREEQPLRQQPLIVAILLVVAVVVVTSLLISGGSIWGAVVALVTLGLVTALVFAAKLETTVDRETITAAFHFLWPAKRIALSEVRKAEAVKYHPLLDYGGYGVRLGFRGWAFNVSGNEGVLVETSDGSRVLIGSQHPKELASAIAVARSEQNA